MRKNKRTVLLTTLMLLGIAASTFALTPHQEAINQAVDDGCAYLQSRQIQYESGGVEYGYWDPGFSAVRAGTGMALLALVPNWEETSNPDPMVDDEYIRRGVNYLLYTQLPGGNWPGNVNYETSAAVWGLAAVLGKLPAGSPSIAPIETAIENAKNWLVHSQWDESCLWGSVPATHDYYGGFGYGDHSRPDLSNTQFGLVALNDAGLGAASDVWTKGIVYVERCQYLTHSDGGMWYTPDGYAWGFGSTGSMTAAGVWAYRLCGLPAPDARIQAALTWLDNHYTYTQNPNGFWNYSHYYYLWSAAKAFLVCDIKGEIGGLIPVDPADDPEFDPGWYYDFSKYLVGQQRLDGSWLSASYNGGLILDTEWALYILQKIPGALYAVQLSIAPPAVSVEAGEDANFTVTLENVGLAQDSYNMEVLDLPGDFSWTMQNPVLNVPPGTSVPLPLAITTPANLAIWDDTPFPFRVRATSFADPNLSNATTSVVVITVEETPVTRILYVDSLLTALMEAVETAEIAIGVEAADESSDVVASLLYHLLNAEREKHMALDRLERGDTLTAINMLNATANMMVSFINAVESRRGLWILDPDADSFVEQAELIISLLPQCIEGGTPVAKLAGQTADGFGLLQNYPNPFNPATDIWFSIPEASHVRVDVYNMLGQRIRTLTDRQYPAGFHCLTYDGSNTASGVYVYRIQAGDMVESRKMMLVK